MRAGAGCWECFERVEGVQNMSEWVSEVEWIGRESLCIGIKYESASNQDCTILTSPIQLGQRKINTRISDICIPVPS